jgi:hypothetical protein
MEYLTAQGHNGKVYVASADYWEICVYSPETNSYHRIRPPGTGLEDFDMA